MSPPTPARGLHSLPRAHTASVPYQVSFVYGPARYSLTFCTDWKTKCFETAEPVDLVLSQFLRVAELQKFVILAYCFMPDHVHLLIEGSADDSDARKFIIKSKQCSAHAYASRFGRRLWQPFGYERIVRDDEDTCTVARYIVENPVRAGLVATVADYPFVGSQVYDLKDLIGTLPDT